MAKSDTARQARIEGAPWHLDVVRRAAGPARMSHAVRAWGEIGETLEGFARGESRLMVTCGRVSSLDVILGALAIAGEGCELGIWCYGTGRVEAEVMGELPAADRISRLRVVVDRSGLNTEYRPVFLKLQEVHGRDVLRVCHTHMKVATIVGNGWHLLVEGSANLAKNLRIEQIRVSDDPAAAKLVCDLEDELWRYPPPDLAAFVEADSRRMYDELTAPVVRHRKRRFGVSERVASTWGDGFIG